MAANAAEVRRRPWMPAARRARADGAKRHPGQLFPHSAEPALGLAEGETRGLHAGYSAVPRARTDGANTTSRMLHSAIGMNAAAGMPLASQIRPLTTGTITAHE